MTDREIDEFDSAVRMIDLMTANDSVFRNNAKALEMKTALVADIDVLEAEGAARVSSSGVRKDGTIDRRAARKELEAFVRKIAARGKTIKRAEPDFDNKFVLPRGSLSSQQLLDTARAFQTDLTTDAIAKFGEYGMTSATPANIESKINAFETGRAQQTAGKSGGVAATAETKAAIKRLKATRRTLKEIGESITEETGDAGLIAEWRSACRVEQKAPKDDEEPPTT